MKYVYHFLKEFKIESIMAPLFKMLEAVFELMVPLVMAKIIDFGIKNADTGYIIHMCLLLIFLAVVGLISSVTAQYFAAKAAIGAATNMRRDLFFQVMQFSDEKMEKAGSVTLVTRMTNDINQVQNGMNMFLRLFLRSPFIVLGAMMMAFIVDARAALIFAIVIPGLGLIVYLVMRKTMPIFRLIQQNLDKLLNRVGENLEGVRVVRAFCQETAQKQNFRKMTGELYKNQKHAGTISALLNPLTFVFVNLGIVALLWTGGVQIHAGTLTQGATIALVNYMSQILVELIKLANLILILTRAFASISRMQEIMEMTADERSWREANCLSNEKECNVNRQEELLYRNVSYAYPNAKEAISNVSFAMKQGEMLGIVGGTGSGKSTLIKLLNRSFDPISGEIQLFGQPLKSITEQELIQMVAIVPQKAELFMGTIADNLCMGKEDVTQEEMLQALEWAQATEIVAKKEHGLKEVVQKGGTNLSGGQRQRLTIARALLGHPKILVLDDSSSALDLSTEFALRRAIANLSWHPMVIVISQRVSSVLNANQILVMENGELVDSGTHEELIKGSKIYQEIYYAQFPKEEEAQ